MATPSRKGPSNKKVGKDHTTQNILLIIAILLVAVGIAYYALVYRPKQLALQTTNPPPETATEVQNNKPEDIPSIDTYNYVEISEWGIVFPSPVGYEGDTGYTIKDDISMQPYNTGKGSAAYIFSRKMASRSDYVAGCSPVILLRSHDKLAEGTMIGNVWYMPVNGGALCYSNGAPSEQEDFLSQVIKSLRQLKPKNN